MQARTITRYVAIGDSLTEGIWDWGQGDRRAGFAHVLADQLRAQGSELQFHNLGVGGARTSDVMRTQAGRAVELRPDLLTLVVGANDVPTTTVLQFRRDFAGLIERIKTGMDGVVVAANLPDVSNLLPAQYASYRSALVGKITEFNAIIAETLRAHEIPIVDLYNSPGSADRRNISSDGLHPNPRGYRLMAAAFADVLNELLGLQLDVSLL